LPLVLAMAAKQHAAIGVRMILDPFDPAATSEELVNSFLSPRRFGLSQQHAAELPLNYPPYALPFRLVAGIALGSRLLTCAIATMLSFRQPTMRGRTPHQPSQQQRKRDAQDRFQRTYSLREERSNCADFLLRPFVRLMKQKIFIKLFISAGVPRRRKRLPDQRNDLPARSPGGRISGSKVRVLVRPPSFKTSPMAF
jgi:hypothetical protein